jgi:hypothetical protein
MLSSKTSLDVALDVRSYERVVVISDSGRSYNPDWVYLNGMQECIEAITPDSVVIVDAMSLTYPIIETIGWMHPRLLAFRPTSDDHARSIKKLLTAMYPWHESWVISTDVGRFIVVKGIVGQGYDRDSVVDMRVRASA